MGKKDVFKVGDVVYLEGYPEHQDKPEFWAKVTGIIENSPILYEISFAGSVELRLPADLLAKVTGVNGTLNDINTIFRLIHPINDEIERLEMIDKEGEDEVVDGDLRVDLEMDNDPFYDPDRY